MLNTCLNQMEDLLRETVASWFEMRCVLRETRFILRETQAILRERVIKKEHVP